MADNTTRIVPIDAPIVPGATYHVQGKDMTDIEYGEYLRNRIPTPIAEPITPIEEPSSGISRFAGQVGVGLVQTLGTIPGAAEAVTHSDFLHNMNNSIEDWTKEHTPEDMGLSDQVARGLGSSLTFYIPSIGIVKGASMALKLSKAASITLGMSSATIMESMSEAGATYREALAKHGDADKASESAAITFAANLPLNAITEQFGPLGKVSRTGLAGVAEKGIKSGISNMIEEPIQDIISKVSQGELPTGAALGTSAVVGGIVGIITGGGFQALDTYTGKKSDFLDEGLQHTKNLHNQETSTETPLITIDTADEVLRNVDLEMQKAAAPAEAIPTEVTEKSKYAPEPEGTMPQASGIPTPEVQQETVPLTDEVKKGIRINLLSGSADTIAQIRMAKAADADGAYRLYRETVNQAIRENKVKEAASLDTAIADTLGVAPILETEISTRIAESPITKRIAFLEATPIESRTPEIQAQIDKNKELLANTTLSKQLAEVKETKATTPAQKTTTTITRKRGILDNKYVEKRTEGEDVKRMVVTSTEDVVPVTKGKKGKPIPVDRFSPDYIDGLINSDENNIAEMRTLTRDMEDKIDELDITLLDYKKGSDEYITTQNKIQSMQVQVDKLSAARTNVAGNNEMLLDSLGFQKIYEALRNPDILIADAMENLRTIGTAIYDASMRVSDFIVSMKRQLGTLYERFRPHLITLFDVIKNQRGMVGAYNPERITTRLAAYRDYSAPYSDIADRTQRVWLNDTNIVLNPNVMSIGKRLVLFDPDMPGRGSIDVGQVIILNKTFIAYPELMNLQIVSEPLPKDVGGVLDVDAGKIYISDKTIDQDAIIDIIIHEVQHAIQYIEGWALGSSPEAMEKRIMYNKDIQITPEQRADIAYKLYKQIEGERQSEETVIRRYMTMQEHQHISPLSVKSGVVNPEDILYEEGDKLITAYDKAPFGRQEAREWKITKDTDPNVAAQRLIDFDTLPLAKNDIRKDWIPAQRHDGTHIVTGKSQMEIGFHSDRETTELGWVTPHGDFVPESALAHHEVPDAQDRLFGKEKITVSKLAMSAQKVVEPTGQVSTNDFDATKVDIQDTVRAALSRYEKTANDKGIALDNHLRTLGFSETAVSELMNIHNSMQRGSSVIKKSDSAQRLLLHRLEREKNLDVKAVLAELSMPDIEWNKMSYADMSKLINYIQATKGIKLDDIIDTEVMLSNIANDVMTRDEMTEFTKVKSFFMQTFLSPDIVLKSSPVGEKIYNVLDKAMILFGKGRERIFGKTGFDIDSYDELIKVESITAERIAAVLDGKADYQSLTTDERTVTDKMRAAFKYMLDEFVNKRSADVTEATLVRQLAPSVKYVVGEKAVAMKARLHELQTEYSISKGGMEALDLLRMEKENYLPHLFDSNEIIKTAVIKLQELLQTNPLSPKVTQLRNTIARLEGGDFVMQSEIPNELYFAHLEQRTDVEGYKLDAGIAFHKYVQGWLRKMYLEPAVNVAKDLYIQLPSTQKPYAKWFILEVAGRNKRTPGASIVSMAEWIRLIGANIGSALNNATGILNTFAEGGAHAIDGMQRAMTPEGRHEFYREGLGYEVVFKASPTEELHGKLEKLRKISGILFDQVELGNRMHAFHTGKSMGESLGLKGDELTSFAIDTMHKVQFRYGMTGMAKGMRGWPGVATQFSSFTIKQWELILGKWRTEPDGIKKIVAYLMLSAGATSMMKFLGMDISNAAGIPLSYGELLNAVTSASKGDWEAVTKHYKMSTQGGTGILPREVIMTGPAVNLLMQIKDTKSPDWLGRIGNELSPPLANKAIDFYYALKHGDAKDGEFPIYAYESNDPLQKAIQGPKDLKYTLSLYGLILRTFGPRPVEETEIQRREFDRLLTSQEITSILHKYDKALTSGNVDKMTELFNLYPGIVYDRGTGALKRRAMDLSLTREQRSLFKRKQLKQVTSLEGQ